MRPQPGRDMLMITAFGVYVTWCVWRVLLDMLDQ